MNNTDKMFCQIFLIMSSIGATLCDFLHVPDGCKYWSYLKIYGNGGKTNLHCILDQDFQPGLVYANVKLISKGNCPIYNRYAKQIDSTPCNEKNGKCPERSFPSNIGVTFSGCYDAIRKHTKVITPARTEDGISPSIVSLKHTDVITPPRTEDESSPSIVSISDSNQTALIVLSTVLAAILTMNFVLFVRYFMCRPKPYRGAKERPVTKEEIEVMTANVDTLERVVTKEQMQAKITHDTQEKFRIETQAMIPSDTAVGWRRSEGIPAVDEQKHDNDATYIPSNNLIKSRGSST